MKISLTMIQIVLIILKLTGAITWGWLWVFAPLLFIAAFLVSVLLVCIFAIIFKIADGKDD